MSNFFSLSSNKNPILEDDFFEKNNYEANEGKEITNNAEITNNEENNEENNSKEITNNAENKQLSGYFDHIRVEAAMRNKLDIYENLLKNLEKKIESDNSDENIKSIFEEARMYEFTIICGIDYDPDKIKMIKNE